MGRLKVSWKGWTVASFQKKERTVMIQLKRPEGWTHVSKWLGPPAFILIRPLPSYLISSTFISFPRSARCLFLTAALSSFSDARLLPILHALHAATATAFGVPPLPPSLPPTVFLRPPYQGDDGGFHASHASLLSYLPSLALATFMSPERSATMVASSKLGGSFLDLSPSLPPPPPSSILDLSSPLPSTRPPSGSKGRGGG